MTAIALLSAGLIRFMLGKYPKKKISKKVKNVKALCPTSSFNATFPKYVEVIRNLYKRKLTEEKVFCLIKEINPDGLIAGV